MTQIAHLGRSRIAKVLTDETSSNKSFDDATATLDAVGLIVVTSSEEAATHAGQAAILTIVTTGVKCFGRTAVVLDSDVPLKRRLSSGETIFEAVRAAGAEIVHSVPTDATHIVSIGELPTEGVYVRCWWGGWSAGVLPPWDDAPLGGSSNPLAGIFAGALAVREVFANCVGRRKNVRRASVISLWAPSQMQSQEDVPPSRLSLPNRLWLVGLGHIGQGFLWSLSLLPLAGAHAVLQDDQLVGEENVATGLVTYPHDFETSNHKTRVAMRWLEAAGWTTSIVERRNHGDFRLDVGDPPVILTSIDEPMARIEMANAGHEYLIDAGVGHGPTDFEIGQIRVVPKTVDARTLWTVESNGKDMGRILLQHAYREHANKYGNCGTYSLAEASVAVPFVGAAIGALTISQLLRLAALRTTSQVLQIELGAPAAAGVGAQNPGSAIGLGGIEFSLS